MINTVLLEKGYFTGGELKILINYMYNMEC
jgi:hypothetical protein